MRFSKCTQHFFMFVFLCLWSLCVRCSWNISCVSVKILVKYSWMPEQIYPPLFPLLEGATKSLRHAPSCPAAGSLFDPLMPIKRSHVFRACCVNFLCGRVVPRPLALHRPNALFWKFLHVTYCLLPISNTFSGLRLAERWISLSQCRYCWHWHCHCQGCYCFTIAIVLASCTIVLESLSARPGLKGSKWANSGVQRPLIMTRAE